MAITKHTVHMDLSALSDAKISEANSVIASLTDSPELGILDYSGLLAAHITPETKRGLNRHYTHSFVMIFITATHRDNYIDHPIHLEAVNSLTNLGINIEKVCSVDVDAKLSAPEAQRLLTIFFETHRISLKDLMECFKEQNQSSRATKDIAETIAHYFSKLPQAGEVTEFWTSLQQSLFVGVMLNNTSRMSFYNRL